ncbi:MAG: hypothetical protein RL710_1583 [Pseudomonadota bacterium]|jgi:predicted AAA+ superfamily ATPase
MYFNLYAPRQTGKTSLLNQGNRSISVWGM